MPAFFKFTRTSEYVLDQLTGDLFNAVETWQDERLDYEFSFHTQHEAGWPVYLVEPDGPSRNLPKINVKVPTKPPKLLQEASVQKPAVSEDFTAVVRANIPAFQALADLYYTGREVEVVRLSSWVVVFKCNAKRSHAKPIQVELPKAGQQLGETFCANFKRFAKVPKCPVHKVQECIYSEVVSIAPEDLAKVTQQYDRNGEIRELV
jgi:hypothetical protein